MTVTGLLEVAGAIGLLVPLTARAAGVGLALMMLAMFPANVYAARHGVTLRGQAPTPLWLRTPAQAAFVAAALWATW